MALACSLLAARAEAQTPPQPPSAASAELVLQLGRAFSDVARRTLPSVVAIFVEIVQRNDNLMPLQGFWGMVPEQPNVQHGGGSGVIVRADGAILTNHHVIEGASRIRVRLSDGRTYPARLVGSDPATDLAVLRIDASGLTVARWGDSDAAQVGEWVLAIGAPFGLEASVTHGVLSAKGRGGFGVNQIEDYLQTDASINPGNSGGALVNLRGEVLGVNTMIIGRGQGIGFAVPSRMCEWVTGRILRHGRVTRGWLGFGAQDVTPDLERAFNVRANGGVIVNEIARGGPADRGGMHVGDVLVSLEGHPVQSDRDVVRELADHGIGDRLTVRVLRGGRAQELQLTTIARPGDRAVPPPPPPTPDPEPTGFGMVIDAMNPVIAQRAGLVGNQGVVIVQVHRGGAADRAGLRPGDVILMADGAAVAAPDAVVAAARDGRAVLLVRRGQSQEFVGLSVRGAP